MGEPPGILYVTFYQSRKLTPYPKQPRREDSIQDMTRQQQWARSEGGSRNAGTGRASAVTGHSKSARAGGGSIVGRRSEQGQAQKKSSAKLAKAPSALSAVSDKRARFA